MAPAYPGPIVCYAHQREEAGRTADRPGLAAHRRCGRSPAAGGAPLHGVAPAWPTRPLAVLCQAGACGEQATPAAHHNRCTPGASGSLLMQRGWDGKRSVKEAARSRCIVCGTRSLPHALTPCVAHDQRFPLRWIRGRVSDMSHAETRVPCLCIHALEGHPHVMAMETPRLRVGERPLTDPLPLVRI